MPRQSKLTPATQEKILTYLAAGAYVETAAVAAGVAKSTLYDWMKRGEAQRSGKYRTFKDAVDQALAQDELAGAAHLSALSRRSVTKKFKCTQCECENTVSVPVPSNVSLEATKWRLQKKYRDPYGDKVEIKLEGEVALAAGMERLHGALAKKRAREALGDGDDEDS